MGDNAGTAATEKKSRNSYTLEKKLKCIATAKRLNNIDNAAQLEGVPRQCLGKLDGAEAKKVLKALKLYSSVPKQGIPNGLYELTKTREATEAQELAEILAGFEIEAPDEDDTGHVSDVVVVDDDSAVTDDEDSGPEDENHNLSDDSDF
ncbi:hypothetical protein AAVH_14922 [Aphelenchoides avenae]|nr:hypothetical protein AAVH_14922 [Aphelenchus avenae]